MIVISFIRLLFHLLIYHLDSGVIPSDRKLLFFREQPQVLALVENIFTKPILEQLQKNPDALRNIVGKDIHPHLMLWFFEGNHYYKKQTKSSLTMF